MVLFLRVVVADVADESDTVEQPDEIPDEIELPPLSAGLREAGPGVMVVVPRPAHGGRRENSDVAALVANVELAVTDRVAERVHHPGRMVEYEDPGEATPEDPSDEAVHRLSGKATDHSRNDDARQYHGEVLAVDLHHAAIL